jgi:3-isopropylmalate dehydrogenase
LLRETGRIKQNPTAVKCGEQIGAAVKRTTPKFAGKSLDRSGYGTDEIGRMVAGEL